MMCGMYNDISINCSSVKWLKIPDFIYILNLGLTKSHVHLTHTVIRSNVSNSLTRIYMQNYLTQIQLNGNIFSFCLWVWEKKIYWTTTCRFVFGLYLNIYVERLCSIQKSTNRTKKEEAANQNEKLISNVL